MQKVYPVAARRAAFTSGSAIGSVAASSSPGRRLRLILSRMACGTAAAVRDTAAVAAIAEAWRPWRAYAVMGLWQTLEDKS